MATNTSGNAAASYATNGAGDHVVIFPFMATSHTLPLLHFAKALSVHHKSLRVTLLTTPANLAYARGRLPASVELVELPFPSLPPLPAGVESTERLPSLSLYPTFLRATTLLREPFAAFMASLRAPPLVLVSDFFLGFTHAVATAAGVRRVVFHGMSCFSAAICKSLVDLSRGAPPSGNVVQHGGRFHVPRLPEHVTITADEVPIDIANFDDDPDHPLTRFFIDAGESDVRSWGVLVNSFAELDRDYVAPLESFYQPGARAWLVGPLFLAAGDTPEREEPDPEGCLSWLDQRAEQPGSVVYVSFGSHAHVADEQLDELAHGLVQSGHRFLWAVRSAAWSPPVDVGPNGLIVREWVPQRSVLAHKAVGGFVSQCGWNSVMESLAAGQPLLAWPMNAEQKLNANHVVDVIGAGVRVNLIIAGGGSSTVAVVERTEVEEKVKRLMESGGVEGERIRARAAWAQNAAKFAVSDGGTSRVALHELVEELQNNYGIAPCD